MKDASERVERILDECAAYREKKKSGKRWTRETSILANKMLALDFDYQRAAQLLGVSSLTLLVHVPEYKDQQKRARLLQPGAICGTCSSWTIASGTGADPDGACSVHHRTTFASGQCIQWSLLRPKQLPCVPLNRRGDSPDEFEKIENRK